MCKDPHIIRVYKAFYFEAYYYIAMEWMDAGDLHELIKEKGGKIPEPAMAYITKQIIE